MIYQKNNAYHLRLNTDVLFADYNNSFKYDGFINDVYNMIEEKQLLDVDLWNAFVEQFRLQKDRDLHWRGEFWGKMMRGAAFVYSYSKNEILYSLLTETVKKMMSLQEDSGRLSSYPVECEFNGWDLWCRKYVLLGLQYYLEICKDDSLKNDIVDSMIRQVDYIVSKIGCEDGKKDIYTTSEVWRGLNSSTILEPVVKLYSITGKSQYLEFAQYIIDSGGTDLANLVELAYENDLMPYQYPVTKAYEMMSLFEGVLEYYRATKDEKYKKAVCNFADRILENDFTVIGSCGCSSELFDHSTVRQANTNNAEEMQETCVTVTLMKLMHRVHLLTGESKYADAFERAFYNAYLGALNTENGTPFKQPNRKFGIRDNSLMFDSYSPLVAGKRGYLVAGSGQIAEGRYYGCCISIGSAGIGLVHKMHTLSANDGVVLNLFINGKFTVQTPGGNAVTMCCETNYPADGNVRIRIESEVNELFTLYIRNPEWSEDTRVLVNGTKQNVNNGYIELKKEWVNGDCIELDFDMRTKAIYPISYGEQLIMTNVLWEKNFVISQYDREDPIAKKHIAFRRGPLMLAQENRLGYSVDDPADFLVSGDGYINAKVIAERIAPYKSVIEVEVPLKNGKSMRLTDYASAGKLWNDESKMAVWMLTN